MIKKVELDCHGRPLSIEIDRVAKQADGVAWVRYGETVVLVTAVAAKELKLDTDFFPLTVDYQEKTFAAGKIPGGFSSVKAAHPKRKFSPAVWSTAPFDRSSLRG